MARSSTSRRSTAAAKKASNDRLRKNMWFGGLGAAGLAVVVAVIVLSSFSGNSGSAGGNRADGVVENFSFTLFQGQDRLGAEKLDIDQILGKPIVLNFWAGRCPPCRAEMPDLQEFYEGSKDEVTLLSIDVGQFTGLGSRRDARNLLKELEITYPAGFTGDGGVVREYKGAGMPTTLFITSDGTIFDTWSALLNLAILKRLTCPTIDHAARHQVTS